MTQSKRALAKQPSKGPIMLSAKARRDNNRLERRAALDAENAARAKLIEEGKRCRTCAHFKGVDVQCVPLQSPPSEDYYVCSEYTEKLKQ